MEFLRVISWGNQSRRREMSVVFSSYSKGLICWCASVIKGPLTSCLRPNAFSLSQTRAHHPGTATAGKTSLKWKVLSRSAFNLHCDHSYPLTLLNVENVVVCHAIRLEPITCQICNRKHHTSAMPLHCLSPQEFHQFMYPGVIVEVQGIKCRALLDTGAGRSYVFAALLDRVSSGKWKWKKSGR